MRFRPVRIAAPTLYFEYVSVSGADDAIEAKILLGDQAGVGWHWGSNLVFEHGLGGERENEYELTLGLARTIVDETIAPGFLTILSRIPLEIYQGGRRLGTSEDEKISLPPGTHRLTFVNPRFGFRSEMNVEIKAGEVSAFNVSPPIGRVSVKTDPGTEIFVEGEKVAVGPMSELELPVGMREITVRHPELGEKSVRVDVKRDQTNEITLTLASPVASSTSRPRLAPLSAPPAPRTK